MQKETPSFEALLHGLMNLGVCLYPTAPESRIRELRDDLTQIQERCVSVKNSIKHRQLMFFILLHGSSIFSSFPFDGLVYFVAAPSTIIMPYLPVTYF